MLPSVSRGLGFLGAQRDIADAEIGEPHVAQSLAVSLRIGGEADHRIVAVAARELGETHAGVPGRGGNADRGQHVARAERGLEQAFEEIIGLHRAPAVRPGDIHFTAERQQARRQFGGGIGEGNRAAERAAVADRRMADMRHGERDQRRMPGDLGGAFGLGVAGQRADLDLAGFHRDAGKPADAIQVDQQLRRRQPHVERGDQALAAGEQPRLAVGARQQLDRMIERFRLGIGKWRRLHARSSRVAFSYCVGERRGGQHGRRPKGLNPQGLSRPRARPARERS